MLREFGVLIILLVLLTGCGARDTMYNMESYKKGYAENASVGNKGAYKTYAEEIYNGEISVEEALEVLECDFLDDDDSEYYTAFAAMIDVINSQSKKDINDYYGRWSWLSDDEKLVASYMVMYGVIDIETYDEEVQRAINGNLREIQSGR